MKEIDEIKETGATFTPAKLAEYLTQKILTHYVGDNPLIVDPACGDGILLKSIGAKIGSEGKDCTLIGYDTNIDYLATAKLELSELNIVSQLINEDFLEIVELKPSQLSLNLNENSPSKLFDADIIIANPPYVRTQILGSEKAQYLSKKFGLKGRVDLYYPFLIAMTELLKEGGILGVITSNRYLFTKSGNSIRKFFQENFEILEIIDLGDTKIFDAAVLPAIFLGRKKKGANNTSTKFLKIYEDLNESNEIYPQKSDVFEILNDPNQGYFNDGFRKYKKTQGIVKFTKTKENTWALLSKDEAKWVKRIERNSNNVIGDWFKVRVGIKTTADKVFISDSWENLNDSMPENEILMDLISQENIKSWGMCDNKKLKVLYPHYSEKGKRRVIELDKYPNAKNYFNSHEKTLKGRNYVTKAGRNWFEIWVPQDPYLWKFPKLVFPDISPIPRFYFDYSGKIVNGNCYWISAINPEDEEKLLLIQGIANSNLMTKYHDLVFANKLYAGRRRYFSEYVKQYPLPSIQSKESQRIIEITKSLNITADVDEKNILIKNLEIAVGEAYRIDPVLD